MELGFDPIQLTLAILQTDRQRDESLGWARDLPAYVTLALPHLVAGRTKLITNAGGINPVLLGGILLAVVVVVVRELLVTGIRGMVEATGKKFGDAQDPLLYPLGRAEQGVRGFGGAKIDRDQAVAAGERGETQAPAADSHDNPPMSCSSQRARPHGVVPLALRAGLRA